MIRIKRVEGVTERILQCSKEEFLKKGYENASLRSIAEKANSSKGAIYIRYNDKVSLFKALVQPAADGLIELIKKLQGGFNELPNDEQKERVNEFSNTGFSYVVKYIYDNFDAFKLLLACSDTEIYTEFIHRLVDIDVSCTFKYIEAAGSDAVSSGRLNVDFAHLISQAFYSGVFEVVLHDMEQEKAEEHVNRLRRFFTAGWATILNPKVNGGE